LEAALVQAVTGRRDGVLDTLRQAILDGPYLRFAHNDAYRPFFALIHSTPALMAYARHLASRYERAIAQAILQPTGPATGAVPPHLVDGRFAAHRDPPGGHSAEPAPVTAPQAQAIAHYVIEALFTAQSDPNPIDTFNALIDLMQRGFPQ
jgi:hypothetical protein